MQRLIRFRIFLFLALAAALIGAVPVYGLTCRKDEGAVRALEDYLRRA